MCGHRKGKQKMVSIPLCTINILVFWKWHCKSIGNKKYFVPGQTAYISYWKSQSFYTAEFNNHDTVYNTAITMVKYGWCFLPTVALTYCDWVIIGWGNGFLPVRFQSITPTSDVNLILVTNFNPNMTYFLSRKFAWKWHPFCFGLHVLIESVEQRNIRLCMSHLHL